MYYNISITLSIFIINSRGHNMNKILRSSLFWIFYIIAFPVAVILSNKIVFSGTNIGTFYILCLVCNLLIHVIFYNLEDRDGFFSKLLKGLCWIVGGAVFIFTLFISFFVFVSDNGELNIWEFPLAVFWPVCISTLFSEYMFNADEDTYPFIFPISVIRAYVMTIPFALLHRISWICGINFLDFLLSVLYYGSTCFFAGCISSEWSDLDWIKDLIYWISDHKKAVRQKNEVATSSTIDDAEALAEKEVSEEQETFVDKEV